jgi:predicted Zn-dependent peptidase
MVNIHMKSTLFEHFTFANMRVHLLSTKQFKTTTLSLAVGVPLREDSVTPVSLIAHIMKRVNGVYPQADLFRQKLEDMYGSIFAIDVQKRANYQIVTATIDVIADDYIHAGDDSLLEQSLHFLMDSFTNPAVDENGFLAKFVAEEKRTIEQKLLAMINDKGQYAAKRCIEEMCLQQPFRLSSIGVMERLSEWDCTNLLEFFENWKKDAIYDLFVVGDTTVDQFHSLLTKVMKHPVETAFQEPKSYVHDKLVLKQNSVRTIEERMDVGQGKLNIGLRTTIGNQHTLFPALQFYNGLLGGFSHSKLFTNVREKHSLAYSTSSRLVDGCLGIYMIQAGIDIAKKEQALAIIYEQLQELRDGIVGVVEMQQTKALIANAYRSLADSPYELIAFEFGQHFSGSQKTPAEVLASYDKVTVDDIVQVAETMNVDTVYFLRDRGE